MTFNTDLRGNSSSQDEDEDLETNPTINQDPKLSRKEYKQNKKNKRTKKSKKKDEDQHEEIQETKEKVDNFVQIEQKDPDTKPKP